MTIRPAPPAPPPLHSDGLSSDTFYPFGQEQTASVDPNHYKFTGKERDQESGLDYFGARYYGSNMGRFMSPDWAASVEPVPYARLDNHQSLNLYAYVGTILCGPSMLTATTIWMR